MTDYTKMIEDAARAIFELPQYDFCGFSNYDAEQVAKTALSAANLPALLEENTRMKEQLSSKWATQDVMVHSVEKSTQEHNILLSQHLKELLEALQRIASKPLTQGNGEANNCISIARNALGLPLIGNEVTGGFQPMQIDSTSTLGKYLKGEK